MNTLATSRATLFTILIGALVATEGCRAIEVIFKAGVWVGIVSAGFNHLAEKLAAATEFSRASPHLGHHPHPYLMPGAYPRRHESRTP